MLSEQFSAFVIAQLLGPYSTSAGFLRLCTFRRERACTFFFVYQAVRAVLHS